MKIISIAVLSLLIALPAFSGVRAPLESDAEAKVVGALIEKEINRVLKILKDETTDQEAKRAEVMKIVDPLFDLKLMGKLVLGRRNWPKFDKGQRKTFLDLFVKTLQDSYFDKVDLLTDEAVEFEKPVRKKKKFHVLTHIVSKDQRYEMLYKLYKKKGAWRVYDVEIEGISVVKSYGSQYDQFLRKSSVKKLLVKMREKTITVPKDLQSKEKRSKSKG